MRVKQTTRRYHVNLSHPEYEALAAIVDSGLDAIDAGDPDFQISLAARKSMGHWKGGNPLRRLSDEATPPKPHRRPLAGTAAVWAARARKTRRASPRAAQLKP